jgi:hypothetical protein
MGQQVTQLHERQMMMMMMMMMKRCSTHKQDSDKTIVGLLCLAGELRSNKKNLEELWGTD